MAKKAAIDNAKVQSPRIAEGASVRFQSTHPLYAGQNAVVTQRTDGASVIVELQSGDRIHVSDWHLSLQCVNKVEREYLTIGEITIDGGTQSRAKLNLETVDEYALDQAAGAEFPPVEVYYDGSKYWLADGFHRLAAYKKNQELDPDNGNWQNIPAKIHQGDRRAAILHSVGANSNHGLRRTNADKRRAVTTLLSDQEWSQWSDREIAKQCGVSNRFVSNLRSELSVNSSQIERNVTRNGTTYTMDTRKIGQGDRNQDCPKLDNKQVNVEIVENARLSPIQSQDIEPTKLFIDKPPLPEALTACPEVTSGQHCCERQIVKIKPITPEIQLADDVTIGLKSNVDILSSHHVWAAHRALVPRLTPEELEIVSEDWSDTELLDLLKNSQTIAKAVKHLLNKRHHPEYFKEGKSCQEK